MPRRSAGLLVYKRTSGRLSVFLVHPGGPFWSKKDLGAWSLPKGELEPDEDPLTTAQREFKEELGLDPTPPFHPLGQIRQKAGKIVHAWSFEGDCDPDQLVSNTCEIEWPPRSGRRMEIPEIDRGRWFNIPEAREYIREEQRPLLAALLAL